MKCDICGFEAVHLSEDLFSGKMVCIECLKRKESISLNTTFKSSSQMTHEHDDNKILEDITVKHDVHRGLRDLKDKPLVPVRDTWSMYKQLKLW